MKEMVPSKLFWRHRCLPTRLFPTFPRFYCFSGPQKSDFGGISNWDLHYELVWMSHCILGSSTPLKLSEGVIATSFRDLLFHAGFDGTENKPLFEYYLIFGLPESGIIIFYERWTNVEFVRERMIKAVNLGNFIILASVLSCNRSRKLRRRP